jgi:hypothetical protein
VSLAAGLALAEPMGGGRPDHAERYTQNDSPEHLHLHVWMGASTRMTVALVLMTPVALRVAP